MFRTPDALSRWADYRDIVTTIQLLVNCAISGCKIFTAYQIGILARMALGIRSMCNKHATKSANGCAIVGKKREAMRGLKTNGRRREPRSSTEDKEFVPASIIV
jgi:hypothetical protein